MDSTCREKLDELAIETLAMAGTWAILKEDARGPSILLTLAEIYRQMPLPPSTSVPLAITLSSVPGAKIGLNTVSIAEKPYANQSITQPPPPIGSSCSSMPVRGRLAEFYNSSTSY